jgi:DnaJ domain
MKDSDWYAVLGVGRHASRAQIVRAFRKLAFRWHPDRNAGNPELAHQRFLLVHRAYEVLNDPVQRSVFDAKRWPSSGIVVDSDLDAEPAPPPARRPAAPPRERKAAPLAPDPPPKPPAVSAFASRASWFLLGLFIRTIGFVAMVVIGPFAERKSRDDFHRRAPAFVEMVFPLGRIALLAALILAMIAAGQQGRMSFTPAIVLGAIGVTILIIERIAVASFWAMGRGGRSPRD